MIVVKVELWGARTGKVRELFNMTLSNDGELGDSYRGNYDVALYRKGTSKVIRRGRVDNFPRKNYHVGRLVLRALKSVFPEERLNDSHRRCEARARPPDI